MRIFAVKNRHRQEFFLVIAETGEKARAIVKNELAEDFDVCHDTISETVASEGTIQKIVGHFLICKSGDVMNSSL